MSKKKKQSLPNGVMSPTTVDPSFVGSIPVTIPVKDADLGTTAFTKPAKNPVPNSSGFINPYDITSYDVEYASDKKDAAKIDAHNTAAANQQALDVSAREYAAEIQMMNYRDWYDSPEQQAQRMRAAGLNPDLVGLDGVSQSNGTQGNVSAPSPGTPDSSLAFDYGARRLETFQSIINGIGTCVGLVNTAFSTASSVKNMMSQTDALQLSNIKQFEELVYGGVSSRLADAISIDESLDIESWFADDNNFAGLFESYSPEDTPRYRQSFANVIQNSRKLLGQAYGVNKDTAQNQTDFSLVASNPYYDDDVVLQISYTRPVMLGLEKLRLLKQEYESAMVKLKSKYIASINPTAAAEAFNAQKFYDYDFWNAADGSAMARYEKYIKRAQAIIDGTTGSIVDNWRTIYDKNPFNARGLGAAYLIMNRGELPWAEYLTSGIVTNFDPPKFGKTNPVPSVTPNADAWLKENLDNGMFVD